MKIKIGNVTDENVEKKNKKCKKEQTSPKKMNKPTVADRTAQRVEKYKVKEESSVVKVQESLEVGGEERKKKVVNGCNVIHGNGKESNKRKKRTDSQDGTEKKSNEKKPKNKTQIKHENVILDDEKVAKKAKKEKNEFHDKVEKKAKKEQNEVRYNTNGSHVTDDSAVIKKKQEKEKSECKKKTRKDKATQIKHENVWMQEEEEKVPTNAKKEQYKMPVVSAGDGIKHKAKRKKIKAEQKETTVTKKKNAKQKLSEREMATKTPEEVCELKLKKKKKKNDSPGNGKPEDFPKEAEQKKEKVAKSDPGQEEGETKQKKKGEKPKKRKSSGLDTEEETPSSKMKKHKVEEPKCEATEYQEPSKGKKKKSSVQNEKQLAKLYPDSGIKETKEKETKATETKEKATETKEKETKEKETKNKETKEKEMKKKETKEEKTKKKEKETKKKEKETKEEKGTTKKEKMKKEMKKERKEKTKKEKKNGKKGIKEELDKMDVPQGDVVFLSEKTGNTDELTINLERRRALQMEVDKASHPQKGFGQWSTAQFESSQQQQKFLRLMGGLKKNLQPAAAASAPKPNMALGKDAQERLQQGLMREFERAHSRRIDFNSREAGLGFSESPKKFFIDVNRCRSLHFDD